MSGPTGPDLVAVMSGWARGLQGLVEEMLIAAGAVISPAFERGRDDRWP